MTADDVRLKARTDQLEAIAEALSVALRVPERSPYRGQWEAIRDAVEGFLAGRKLTSGTQT